MMVLKQMHIRQKESPHIHKQSVCCVASSVDSDCGRMHPTNREVGAQAVILSVYDCVILFLASGG